MLQVENCQLWHLLRQVGEQTLANAAAVVEKSKYFHNLNLPPSFFETFCKKGRILRIEKALNFSRLTLPVTFEKT